MHASRFIFSWDGGLLAPAGQEPLVVLLACVAGHWRRTIEGGMPHRVALRTLSFGQTEHVSAEALLSRTPSVEVRARSSGAPFAK
jgi:hypothetical protein